MYHKCMKEVVIDNVTVTKRYSFIRPTWYNNDEVYVFNCEVEFPIAEVEKLLLWRHVVTPAQLEELDRNMGDEVKNEYKHDALYFATPHVVFMNTQDGKEKMDICGNIGFRKNKDGEDVAYTYAVTMRPTTALKITNEWFERWEDEMRTRTHLSNLSN